MIIAKPVTSTATHRIHKYLYGIGSSGARKSSVSFWKAISVVASFADIIEIQLLELSFDCNTLEELSILNLLLGVSVVVGTPDESFTIKL